MGVKDEKIKKLERAIEEKDEKIQTLEREIEELKKKNNDKVNTVEKNPVSNVRKKDEKIKKLEITIEDRDGKIKRLQRDILNLNESNEDKKREIEKLKGQVVPQERCYTQYFNGNILNIDTPKDTEWFVNSLERGLLKTIRSTRFLYKFDIHNKVDFHWYIDNRPNIVVVVKMTNEQTIAGYSKPAFIPNRKDNIDYQSGMMFAFNKRKIFTLKQGLSTKLHKTIPKPITYDEYYIIWGNSEIRIKSGADELFSNYATANCSYEEKGNEKSCVSDLFSQKERDTKLLDYELYQIEFEE